MSPWINFQALKIISCRVENSKSVYLTIYPAAAKNDLMVTINIPFLSEELKTASRLFCKNCKFRKLRVVKSKDQKLVEALLLMYKCQLLQFFPFGEWTIEWVIEWESARERERDLNRIWVLIFDNVKWRISFPEKRSNSETWSKHVIADKIEGFETKREGWQDKKRIYLLARRWSRIPQHSRSRSFVFKCTHQERPLKPALEPVASLCFLIALDSLLSLSLHPPRPQT